MKLTIYGPGMNGGATFHAHRAGCAHGNLPKYSRAERFDGDFASRDAVVELLYADIAAENDDDISMYSCQVLFAPCVTIK